MFLLPVGDLGIDCLAFILAGEYFTLRFSSGSESELSARKLSSWFEDDTVGATEPFPLSSRTLSSKSSSGAHLFVAVSHSG